MCPFSSSATPQPPSYSSHELESQQHKKTWDQPLYKNLLQPKNTPKLITACICPCGNYADISDQTGYGAYAVHCLIYLAGITLCMCLPNGICLCLQRGHVRKSHGVYGDVISDLVESHLCYPCVLVQMGEQVRHDKRVGQADGGRIKRV